MGVHLATIWQALQGDRVSFVSLGYAASRHAVPVACANPRRAARRRPLGSRTAWAPSRRSEFWLD
jgi:hypothetical protein